MSVSPIDFLISASEYAASNSEINKRNGLSRAYYAAYHISLTIFPFDMSSCEPSDKGGMHKKYITQLSSAEKKSTERLIGIKLSTLHSRRIKADYKLDIPINSNELAMQLTSAKEIFNLVESVK